MPIIKDFIRFNSCVNVDCIKISTITSNTLKQAREENNYLNGDLVILTDFKTGTSVDADYYSPSGQGGASMTFYKKTPRQKYYDLVCQIQGGYFIGDYNILNNEYYHYMVAVGMPDPTSPNNPLTGKPNIVYNIYQNQAKGQDEGLLEYIKINWNSWSICDIEESAEDENTYIKKGGSVWKLAFNISEESLNQNLSITSWDTLGKYPKISIGQRNFESSTFTCLLGAMEEYVEKYTKHNCNNREETDYIKKIYGYTEKENPNSIYSRENSKLDSWKKFCSNGNLKLLKDVKGNAWIIEIVGIPNNNIDIRSNIQETMISFEWQEVVDINKVSIIGLDSFKKTSQDIIEY